MSVEIGGREVDLWYTRLGDAHDEDLLERCRRLLTDEEAARGRRFVFDKDRHQFLVTRALVRTTLSKYAGIDPAAWRFGQNEFGKPFIIQPSDPGIAFNLSHTSGCVVCAVTTAQRIGVDVERIDRQIELLKIGKRFFAAAEFALLEQTPAPDRRALFFQLWTLKEAYIKAVGKGLSIPLASFEFDPTQKPISFSAGTSSQSETWAFAQMRLLSDYQLALAVPQDDLEVRIREVVPLAE